ncbi:hypothetical protein PROFUN_08269 [Planoprotostelium fungivorum]|uniref:DUF4139 domain-containing protein n=1 Tax=Planoprotostelium fungivorum TaxID=1890364 RepID=A0A2P6NJZ8_9EUKA|nr:hypothetical protein PROFUN_08269 [Planoprotostelium fungivorum]
MGKMGRRGSNEEYYSREGNTCMPDVEEREVVPQRELKDGDVALFIHNGSSSVVTEIRRVTVDPEGEVSYGNLPRDFVPSSVSFRSITDPEAVVLSSSIRPYASGSEETPEVRPQMDLTLETEKLDQEHLTELVYHASSNLKFSANYVAILEPKGDRIKLDGHWHISNDSGRDYIKASVFLVHKDKFTPSRVMKQSNKKNMMNSLMKSPSTKTVAQSKRYHADLLPRPLTVKDKHMTQFHFLSSSVPVKTLNIIHCDTQPPTGTSSTDKDMYYNTKFTAEKDFVFANTEENGLGFKLPSGPISFYRREDDGFGALHGSDLQLNTQPKGINNYIFIEQVPIVAHRKPTHFSHNKFTGELNETLEYSVENQGAGPVDVILLDSVVRGAQFELVNSTWTRGTNAEQMVLQLKISLRPNETKTVTSSIKYTMPVGALEEKDEAEMYQSVISSIPKTKNKKGWF